jgi:predicted  nucleic acid-binding Zn-ribbon protein
MADISNELLYEVLKKVQSDISDIKSDVSEVKREFNAMRGHMIAIQSDIHNIYGILARQDDRLERVERRLELREFAEPQQPFDPKP